MITPSDVISRLFRYFDTEVEKENKIFGPLSLGSVNEFMSRHHRFVE